jgi:hypothetical protein
MNDRLYAPPDEPPRNVVFDTHQFQLDVAQDSRGERSPLTLVRMAVDTRKSTARTGCSVRDVECS